MFININADEVVKFTNTLEKLHKSALPVAVRESLNQAAFDVKTNTMLSKAKATFDSRTSNDQFFKANSKVDKAVGFNVNSMIAGVGFFENKLINSSTNWAVKDLEQQEESGTINVKTFIPTVFARKGNTKRGLVKPNFRLRAIRNSIVDANKLSGKNDRQKYIIATYKAGVGGFVLYKRMLWRINSLKKNAKIERTPIYSVSKGRSIKVKGTGFMKLASLETNHKMEGYYIGQARKQIDRLMRR